MSEKKSAVPAAAAAPETPAAEPKKRKASDTAQRRGRPPLTPEVYVEFGTSQYNITDVVERAKADYRTTHKVGVLQGLRQARRGRCLLCHQQGLRQAGAVMLSTAKKASAHPFVQTPFPVFISRTAQCTSG